MSKAEIDHPRIDKEMNRPGMTMLTLWREYCEDALRRTEEAVAEAYDEIKKSRARFRAAASATAAGSPSGGRAAYDAAAEED